MSAEEAATEGLNAPIDQNKAAADDAKALLAELEAAGPDAAETTSKPENNGATNGDAQRTPDDQQAESDEKNDDGEAEAGKEGRSQDRDHKRRDRDDDRRGRGRGGRGGRGAGRGRGNFRGRDSGVKSNLVREEKSDDPDAIRKQMEFYFSDSNLPMDQFLLDKVGGSENHPVEISLLRTFKRMRHFEPMEAIVDALKTSKTLKLVDDNTKVQRKQPLSKATDNGINTDHLRVYEDKAMPRSVYVKGFGEEKPSTQFDIEAWFSDFGPTNAIRLRRSEDKTFKGSVFAEFESEDLAQKFLALDPKPKYKDRDLQIMGKKEYCEKKVDDIKAGRIQAGKDRGHGSRDNRGRGGKFEKGRRNDKEDDRDWRTRRDEDRKNGFRDDKRRDHRDRDRKRRSSIEKDDRGIPVVKETSAEEQAQAKEKHEKDKKDAIDRAKAIVEKNEQERKAKAAGNGETAVTEGAPAPEPVKQESAKIDEVSKKREREEDQTAATEEPAAKKIDVKAEASDA